MLTSIRGFLQAFGEIAVALCYLIVADADTECLLSAYYYNALLRTGNTGVEEISLQHKIVLRVQRNNNGGILAALRFVDSRGIR